MKKVGIIGGMGPESTIDYYQQVVSKFQTRIGSKEKLPELFINSINMYKMFELLANKQTGELIQYLAEAVQKLESIGADFVVMAANTPHIVFEQVQQKVRLPMISIVEATYVKAAELDIQRIGLIGTKFTMENDFFKKPFISNNMKIVLPNQIEQEYVHKKIVEELENGIVKNETKREFLQLINRMIRKDQIQGLILGCTELPMLIKKEDLTLPLLNTTEIHVNKIIDTIFSEDEVKR